MKIIKNIIRIAGWFFAGIALLIVLALLAIQLPFVKNKILHFAEQKVNNALHAQISVGKLSGNFFTHLELSDVLLSSPDNDTIAFVSELQLKYQLKPLRNGKILVDFVTLQHPYIVLEQLADSSWNFQHITKPTQNSDSKSNFNMLIQLDRFILENGTVNFKTSNSKVPRLVDSLFIDLAGTYTADRLGVKLNEMKLQSHQPEIEIKKLRLFGSLDKKGINVTKLEVYTAHNAFSGAGVYSFSKNDSSLIQLKSEPLYLDEFAYYLPTNIQFKINPTINLIAKTVSDELQVDLQLVDKEQKIDIECTLHQLIEYLSDKREQVTYNMDLHLEQVDIKHWTNNPYLTYFVNGRITANGVGLDPKTMSSYVKGNFTDVVIYNKPLGRLDLLLNYKAGNVNGSIDGSGRYGIIHLKSDLKQILGRVPVYDVKLQTKKLNVGFFVGGKTLFSSLNMDGSINGSGFKPDLIDATGKFKFAPSQFMEFKVDSLDTQVDFIRNNIVVHSLLLNALSSQLALNGNYHLKGHSNLNLDLIVDKTDTLAHLFKLPDLNSKINLNAHLSGNPDSLLAKANLKLGKTTYQNLVLDTLIATATASMIDKKIDINGALNANKFLIGGFEVDTIGLKVMTDTKKYKLQIRANNKEMKTYVNSLVNLGEVINIELSNFFFGYRGYNWRMTKDTTYIDIAKNEYKISDFNLISSAKDTVQSILIDGTINRNSNQDFKMEVSNLDIPKLLTLFSINQPIVGLLNMQLLLAGDAQSPQVNGFINMDQSAYHNSRFDTFNSNFGYKNKELSLNMNIVPQDSGKLTIEGKIPMSIRLDSMKFDLKPKKTDLIIGNLKADKIPLSMLNIFFPVDEAKGHIQSDIDVSGTVGTPNLSGNIHLDNGKLKVDRYGVDYRKIQTDINFETDVVKVDTFLIQSRKGNMTAKGNVKFNSQLYNADLSTSEITVLFDQFKPFDHRQYNLEMSGKVDLNANKDSALFAGDISIPESQIYLPAVMYLLGQVSIADVPKPLLLVELEKRKQQQDSIVYKVSPDSIKSGKIIFLKNLQGSLKINIPRNTWVKNDDMRLELSGDLELIKHKDFSEIFGTVDVIRGQYNLLGKVFVIKSGTVSLQGGEKVNAELDVLAAYSFRDKNKTRRELGVSIKGTTQSPEIKFNFEGTPIDEGDALSYILFGGNMDALASGQQVSLNSDFDAATLAGTAASALVSSQLTKFLGNTINVDYIDFNSSNSFDNATITVGKYITNKLFVSYLQSIGNLQNNDGVRYEVRLEYELFRFLFLQLINSPITSGFDVIFKFDKKQKKE